MRWSKQEAILIKKRGIHGHISLCINDNIRFVGIKIQEIHVHLASRLINKIKLVSTGDKLFSLMEIVSNTVENSIMACQC